MGEKTISGLRLPKGRFFQRDQKMNVGRVGKIDFFGLDCQKNDSPNAARNGFRSRRENLFFGNLKRKNKFLGAADPWIAIAICIFFLSRKRAKIYFFLEKKKKKKKNFFKKKKKKKKKK